MTWPMWSTSSLVPWNALLAATVASTSQIGRMPRSRAACGRLHDQGGRAGADDHPVPSAVEGQRRVLHHVVGRRGAAGQESRPGPGQQRVRRHVVR